MRLRVHLELPGRLADLPDDPHLEVLETRLRLGLLQARRGQAGVVVAVAERIAEADPERPRRVIPAEHLLEGRAEGDLLLPGDRPGEAARPHHAGARRTRSPGSSPGGGGRGAAGSSSSEPTSWRSRAPAWRAAGPAARRARRARHVQSGAGAGTGRSVGSRATCPESRVARVEDQRAEPVLRLAGGNLGHRQRLLALRDIGLSGQQVEFRHLADRHPGLVHAHQLLGKAQRLPLHLHERPRGDQVPVRPLHRVERAHDRLAEAGVGDVLVAPRDDQLLPGVVDRKVLEQGLRDGDLRPGG